MKKNKTQWYQVKAELSDQDNKGIYGSYHCKKCGCSMLPIKRIFYHVDFGVRHIHICRKCGDMFIEKGK